MTDKAFDLVFISKYSVVTILIHKMLLASYSENRFSIYESLLSARSATNENKNRSIRDILLFISK